MSRLNEFVDEFIFMAKSAADVASKKTGEVVESSKLKYQVKQTEWDIEKAYAKLGAIVYESKRSSEDLSDVISISVAEIDDLNLKLDLLEEKLRAYKNVNKCLACGKDNDANLAFCGYCGKPLDPAPIEVEVEEVPAEEDTPE